MSNFSRTIWARHGESEGNQNPEFYIKKGDSKVGLTEKGWRQVVGTGGALAAYYTEKGVTAWPIVHVSPNQRALESLSGILHGIGNIFPGEPRIYVQSFLTEKFFGAASAYEFLKDEGVPQELLNALSILSHAVYRNDPFTAKHLFGESTKETMIAAKLMMETIRRDIDEGKREHLVVSHGAVMQTALMNWMHVLPKDKNKIGSPGNGDLIETSGEPKNWNFIRIWDGEKGVRVHENIRDLVPPFMASDLPPVPDFLKKTP